MATTLEGSYVVRFSKGGRIYGPVQGCKLNGFATKLLIEDDIRLVATVDRKGAIPPAMLLLILSWMSLSLITGTLQYMIAIILALLAICDLYDKFIRRRAPWRFDLV